MGRKKFDEGKLAPKQDVKKKKDTSDMEDKVNSIHAPETKEKVRTTVDMAPEMHARLLKHLQDLENKNGGKYHIKTYIIGLIKKDIGL